MARECSLADISKMELGAANAITPMMMRVQTPMHTLCLV